MGNEKSSVENIFIEFNFNKNLPSRKKALDISYQIAIKRYLEWVTILKNDEIESLLDKINTNLFITGYSIENEKFTKTKYSALITVNLDLSKIKNYFKNNNIAFFLEEGPKTLIIPVIKYKNRSILWDDPNPWFEAWMKRPLDANLTDFLLPTGEVEDLITLSAKDAEDFVNYKIKNMSTKYSAEEVLILQLEVEQTQGFYNLQLLAYQGLKEEKMLLEDFSYKKEKNLEKSILNLANAFAKKYDDLWVEDNIKRLELESYALVRLNYNSLSDWIKIKRSLLNSQNLSSLEIRSMTNSSAIVFIKFLSKEKLVYDLEENNIYIDEKGETWEISLN